MSQQTATAIRLAGPSLFRLCWLQLLDVMTTLGFLGHSIEEANPVINWLFGVTGSPVTALILAKCFALGLGVWCARLGKVAVLDRINLFYAALIAWNLLAVIVALASN